MQVTQASNGTPTMPITQKRIFVTSQMRPQVSNLQNLQGIPKQFIQWGRSLNADNGMFQAVQPTQMITLYVQEGLLITNVGATAINQLNSAQPVQIGDQQALITPIQASGVMPTNLLQSTGQTIQLQTGKNAYIPPANAVPQVTQLPQMQQTLPAQVQISTGNDQIIYQMMHAPTQGFADQIPGFVQPQMQIRSQITQGSIIVITPTGQIQQVQLAPMNQLQNLRVAQAATLQQPNVMPHIHAGIQAFPAQNIHDLGNVQMTIASALNCATNALAPMPNAPTLQLRLPQAPLEAVQRQNQAQQNQSWNNTSSTHVGVIPPIPEKQPQKPQLSLEPAPDSTDASTVVRMKTLQVTQAKTTKPQAIQHIKQKPQIDTDPIADATLSAQNQASISVSVTVKGMDVAKPSRKRIKCTCPNCVKGEHHPDPRRLHICHIVGCNKAYVKPVSLRLHMRGRHTGISSPHSGERPFKCSWVSCDKRLTSHRHLLNHTRIHVDQNRFQCIQCSMKFTRSDHLSRHMWTHVRIKKDFPHSQESATATKSSSSDSDDGSDEEKMIIITDEDEDGGNNCN